MSMLNDNTTDAANRVLTAIDKEFPELKWRTYLYIDEGWDHEVIILDEAIVFRFPTDNEYTAKLKHEIAVLESLSNKLGVCIPKYKYIAKHSAFVGYKLIKGQQLTKTWFSEIQ